MRRIAPPTARASRLAGTMHARLRAITRPLHLEVEAHIQARLVSLTRESYIALLAAFYGYYEPLDARVRTAARGLALPFAIVDRAPLLARDLVALEAPMPMGIPRSPWIPVLTTPAQLAGCLYVVEGAALGGRILARVIEDRLGLPVARSFFLGAGANTSARWKSVLEWLERVSMASDTSEPIVETACETFRTMGCWLDSRGDNR